jgi:hypothetical protein
VLLGWAEEPAEVDAGPPDPAKRALARALTVDHEVLFLWPAKNAALAGAELLPTSGLRLLGRAPALSWARTRDPAACVLLFDAPDADWRLRAQLALLLAPGSPWPEPPSPLVLDGGWPEATGLRATLRPAVDGDAAVLAAADEAQRERLLLQLEQACEEQGLDFAILGESAFADRLAGGAEGA